MNEFYFDIGDEVLSPQTSHPKFNEVIKEPFYFDCTDEFSPFGNDDGADTFDALERWFKVTKGEGDIMEWLFNHVDGFGFKHSSEITSRFVHIEMINRLLKEEKFFFNCMDEAIIAAAFGQYKICGKIYSRLKVLALVSFERQKLINQQILKNNAVDMGKIFKAVDMKSTRPDEHGSTQHLTLKYLEGLEIMKKDLSKFEEKM